MLKSSYMKTFHAKNRVLLLIKWQTFVILHLNTSNCKYILKISKSGINLKKAKSSSDLKIYYSLGHKTYLNTQHTLNWDLKKFWYKDGLQKCFNKKKTHAIYHSNPLFGVCHICLLLLIYIEVWIGLEVSWRSSEKEGKKPFEQRLDDSLCCFCNNWISSWYNFL